MRNRKIEERLEGLLAIAEIQGDEKTAKKLSENLEAIKSLSNSAEKVSEKDLAMSVKTKVKDSIKSSEQSDILPSETNTGATPTLEPQVVKVIVAPELLNGSPVAPEEQDVEAKAKVKKLDHDAEVKQVTTDIVTASEEGSDKIIAKLDEGFGTLSKDIKGIDVAGGSGNPLDDLGGSRNNRGRRRPQSKAAKLLSKAKILGKTSVGALGAGTIAAGATGAAVVGAVVGTVINKTIIAPMVDKKYEELDKSTQGASNEALKSQSDSGKKVQDKSLSYKERTKEYRKVKMATISGFDEDFGSTFVLNDREIAAHVKKFDAKNMDFYSKYSVAEVTQLRNQFKFREVGFMEDNKVYAELYVTAFKQYLKKNGTPLTDKQESAEIEVFKKKWERLDKIKRGEKVEPLPTPLKVESKVIPVSEKPMAPPVGSLDLDDLAKYSVSPKTGKPSVDVNSIMGAALPVAQPKDSDDVYKLKKQLEASTKHEAYLKEVMSKPNPQKNDGVRAAMNDKRRTDYSVNQDKIKETKQKLKDLGVTDYALKKEPKKDVKSNKQVSEKVYAKPPAVKSSAEMNPEDIGNFSSPKADDYSDSVATLTASALDAKNSMKSWSDADKVFDKTKPRGKKVADSLGYLLEGLSFGLFKASKVSDATYGLFKSKERKQAELDNKLREKEKALSEAMDKQTLATTIFSNTTDYGLRNKLQSDMTGNDSRIAQLREDIKKLQKNREKLSRPSGGSSSRRGTSAIPNMSNRGGDQNTIQNVASSKHLGGVASKYETGGRGAGVVSSGRGDHGGVSYGTYQFMSKGGDKSTASKFVKNSKFAEYFKGLKAGSKEFSTKWKALAKENPEDFANEQQEYIKRTHYDPLAKKILGDTGLDVNTRSKALQEAIFSVSVQHGPNTGVVTKALKGEDIASLTDTQIIKSIYSERSKKNKNGDLAYFKSSSKEVQQSVAKRFQDEQADVMGVLNQEKIAKTEKQTTEKASSTSESKVAQSGSIKEPVVEPVRETMLDKKSAYASVSPVTSNAPNSVRPTSIDRSTPLQVTQKESPLEKSTKDNIKAENVRTRNTIDTGGELKIPEPKVKVVQAPQSGGQQPAIDRAARVEDTSIEIMRTLMV